MKKKISKRGFTDRLYLINLVLTWVYTILCVILTCFGSKIGIEDYSFVSVVAGLVWGELSIHTGFIIWKAKCENINKYGNNDNIQM